MATAETPLLPKSDPPTCESWRRCIAFTIVIVAVTGLGLLLFNSSSPSPSLPNPVVRLCGQAGGVKGSWDADGVAVFQGIPYGSADRWQVPLLTNSCWTDSFDARTIGNICFQFPGRSFVLDLPAKQVENCLNIDVMSKNVNLNTNNNNKLLPIFFFIYGGSNVVGWPSLYTNIKLLAAAGDFCVMVPSYRVGTFGFLTLRELAARDLRRANVSGNYGLEDLRLALQWVQAHAISFGCDPNSVTLLGQSSGGTNILALLSNAQNTGLFHRAISLSGSANFSMNQDAAEVQGRSFVEGTECKGASDVLSCLLNLSTSAVVQATPSSWSVTNVFPASPSGTPNVGLPHVDGVTVQEDALTGLSKGLVDVPLLIQGGITDLIVLADPSFQAMTVTAYSDFLMNHFSTWNDNNATGLDVVNAYREITSLSVWDSFAQLTTDIGTFCASVAIGEAVVKQNLRKKLLYLSVVEQPPASFIGYPSTNGSFHYPFDGWDYVVATRHWDWYAKFVGGNDSYVPLAADLALGDAIRAQWTTFAQTEVPSGMLQFNKLQHDYMVNVIGDSEFSSSVSNVPNERAFFCSVLEKHGLTDMKFWLVN